MISNKKFFFLLPVVLMQCNDIYSMKKTDNQAISNDDYTKLALNIRKLQLIGITSTYANAHQQTLDYYDKHNEDSNNISLEKIASKKVAEAQQFTPKSYRLQQVKKCVSPFTFFGFIFGMGYFNSTFKLNEKLSCLFLSGVAFGKGLSPLLNIFKKNSTLVEQIDNQKVIAQVNLLSVQNLKQEYNSSNTSDSSEND